MARNTPSRFSIEDHQPTLSIKVCSAFPFFGRLYLITAMPSSLSIAICWNFGGLEVDIFVMLKYLYVTGGKNLW